MKCGDILALLRGVPPEAEITRIDDPRNPERSLCVVAEAQAELTRLNARLSCGHRAADNDDGYGGCVLCGFRDGYHEYEEENERLRALLEEVEKVFAVELQAEAYCWIAAKLAAAKGGNG